MECMGVLRGSMKCFTNTLENFLGGKFKAWLPPRHLLKLADVASDDHQSCGFAGARALNPGAGDGGAT